MKTQRGDGMLGFHPYFGIRHNPWAELWAPCAGRSLPKDIPWYLFLLEAQWNPGLLNANRRNRSLENLLGPCRESNTEPPVLWCSASTNCAARHMRMVRAVTWCFPRDRNTGNIIPCHLSPIAKQVALVTGYTNCNLWEEYLDCNLHLLTLSQSST
jgi:hypothetical protein